MNKVNMKTIKNEIKNTVEELWGKIGKSLNKSFRPKEGRLWAGSSGYCMRKFIAKKSYLVRVYQLLKKQIHLMKN